MSLAGDSPLSARARGPFDHSGCPTLVTGRGSDRNEIARDLASGSAILPSQPRLRPVFAATLVLTIALGMGANATMFGIHDRLLFRGPGRGVAVGLGAVVLGWRLSSRSLC
jgi:hypothetical protein